MVLKGLISSISSITPSKSRRIMKNYKYFILAMLCLLLQFFCVENVEAKVVTTPEGIVFDTDYYISNNPQIIEAYGTEFEGLYRHYLEHGKFEGKYPSLQEKNAAKGGEVASNSSQSVFLNPDASCIYVGDSRAYGIHSVVGDDGASWITYPGTRYDVFSTTATQIIDGMNLEGKKIIILYGINDVTTQGAKVPFDNYNYFMGSKAQEWIRKGAKVYFANLIGLNNDYCIACPGTLPEYVANANTNVASFNNMMSKFPANIKRIKISVGSDPFYDGIHYNVETCNSVYNQIKSQL